MKKCKLIEVNSDEHHNWTSLLWRWISGFFKRYKRSLSESQEEMVKYNTSNVDVSEIIYNLTSKEVMLPVWDSKPTVVLPPSNFIIEEERGYQSIPYPKREEIEIIDISTLTLPEIEAYLIELIKDHPEGSTVGIGFEKDNYLDMVIYVYKPVPAFGVSVNVFK